MVIFTIPCNLYDLMLKVFDQVPLLLFYLFCLLICDLLFGEQYIWNKFPYVAKIIHLS